ncbi:3-phosphoshikimate 1-carboxyvinyltransferase [Actinomycetospora sp. NBRC 106375]|uniref:3-phosphoshikimate 1-carboxyvinyltransferase n=1 Tax=Actinomycetospora sp. NBRC 106375 TaxID=3032207 RepID=UPI0024A47EB3|nr:3-phosphoshikimate 1-carboxyvinyltransferase [Actinomycetospora sp. NBRC 106375]GLZ48726.1 3-phosphoshikimate 1-carboxyvinyltransferase [Actinomycetospora sp. NBRC 106375]
MSDQPWAAPTADGPVRGTVSVPGSKSVTNRALVLAALGADGVTRHVRGAARSRDTTLMAGALASLGATVTTADGRAGTVDLEITAPATFRGGHVDCGLAGTVMRFVPPMAALADGEVVLDGDPRARERPMGGIVAGLRGLGVDVTGEALPLTVAGGPHPRGGEVTVDASASSQFVSGLLLSGARYAEGVTVTHAGERGVPSLPHVAMTVAMLRAAGVPVVEAPDRWHVAPGPVTAPTVLDVEPDLSGAAVYLAAALATGGSVTVAGWPDTDLQPGAAVRRVLEAFGARVTLDAEGLTVDGPERLDGVDVDLGEISELTPTVAALAAVAARDGATSRLRGVAHIRGHETDRLAALAAELGTVGARVTETADGLEIAPAPLTAPTRPWGAYADHRMATAGAIVGLVVPGVAVDDVAATTKTLPDFATDWPALVRAGVGV